MDIVANKRKVELTVRDTESIPCSLVGNRMVFCADGTMESEPGRLPWPMPWIADVCGEFAKEVVKVTQIKEARLYNPEEPDQYIEVYARSYIDLNVGQLADQICDLYPKREALVDSGGSRRSGYGQLKEDTADVAKGLIAIGVEKGDKVAVWAVNSPEYVIAQIGIAKSGGVMAPLNAYERGPHIAALLRQSDTTTLIMQVGTKSTENIDQLYQLCPELSESEPGKLKSERFPYLKNIIVISDEEYPGTFRWSELRRLGSPLDDGALLRRQEQIGCEDTVFMIFTSGTTGEPKGVMLSHRNVIENAVGMAELMELSETDVVCVQAPMFHCFGCVASVLTAILRGSAMVLVDKFRPEATLALIERERCTVASGVPTMFIGFINELEKKHYDISTVRTGIVAGSSCPPKMIQDIREVLGIKNIIVAYGLTEASPCVTTISGKDAEDLSTTSVGAAIPGVEVKIVNPDTNEEVASDVRGEIWVKGYNIMSGYYHMPEESALAVDEDGWLHTGDIGCFLPNGYLSIMGRYKDIIIRSGENICPKEIEDVLDMHDAVAEASVVGAPSYLYGEEIIAFIRKKEGRDLTEEMLRQFCKGRLSTNKTPKAFVFLEHFPLSGSGKCLKSALRRMAAEMDEQNNG